MQSRRVRFRRGKEDSTMDVFDAVRTLLAV
jgi:hypothetical protein